MFADEDASAFNARVEALTQALDTSADVATRTSARELVRLVLEFHGAGLERMLQIIGDEQPGLKQRLGSDPMIASLLALHELTPSETLPGEPASSSAAARSPLIQIGRQSTPVGGAAIRAHGADASVCERCGEPLPGSHHHYVDVATRRLSCSCRACWLLSAANQGSHRAVPDRYLAGPALRLTSAQWDALQVPVDIAFFMFNSIIGRSIAFYPSPAGATESALSLRAWRDVEDANPWVRAATPDVEALLVRKSRDDAGYQCFVVPVDACYDLVGRIRLHWNGFDGGEAVRTEVDRFFAEVAARSVSTAAMTVSRS
jgi:hypothetical protein